MRRLCGFSRVCMPFEVSPHVLDRCEDASEWGARLKESAPGRCAALGRRLLGSSAVRVQAYTATTPSFLV